MAASPTASQLRSRIEEISLSIYCQREILRDLEKQKSVAQSQLNYILDPMAQLPLEISGEIFKACLSGVPSFEPLDAPGIFLQVCRGWKKIALATPVLWASISDETIPAKGLHKFDKLFGSWAGRAKSLPLAVSLRRWLRYPRQSFAMVQQYAHRVQNLSLHPRSDEALERVTFEFPSLKTLSLTALRKSTSFLNAQGCVEMLRSAPSLKECTFVNFNYDEDIYAETAWPGVPLTHPSLKHLSLGGPWINDGQESSAIILQYLTLPAIESLRIPLLNISRTDFIAFLTRSSPPLRSLSLSSLIYEEGEIEQCLRLVPGLTNLDIRHEQGSALPLLQLFASAKNLLPDLSSLTIRGETLEETHYRTVIDLVDSRRDSLRHFRLVAEDEDVDVPGPLADEFRQALLPYTQRGMQIHIGTDDDNRL